MLSITIQYIHKHPFASEVICVGAIRLSPLCNHFVDELCVHPGVFLALGECMFLRNKGI